MKKIIALAVATAISAPAMADLTLGASARYQIDNGAYTGQTTKASADAAAVKANAAEDKKTLTQGDFTGQAQNAANADTQVPTNRVLLSIAGSSTAESGLFVSAKATLQIAAGKTANAAGVDGDNSITIGNDMANVVLGYFEPAGAFSDGPDTFEQSALNNSGDTAENAGRARDSKNIGLNITAVENLTLQVSSKVDSTDVTRLVAGYDFGAFTAKLGHTNIKGSDNQNSVTVGTELGGIALNASYGEMGAKEVTNINASYMGFGLALQNEDNGAGVEEQEVYGSYAVANAAGLEGLTVTVGFGTTDFDAAAGQADPDTKYGVRLDYAF